MNVFNRVVVLIVVVLVIAASVITLLVATGAVTPDVLAGGFGAQLEWVAGTSGGNAAATIAVSIVVILLMLPLLVWELVPHRPQHPLVVASSEEGVSTIDRESVRELAEKTAVNFRDVQRVTCSVKEKADGLLISCQAWVTMGTNIPEISGELKDTIRSSVEQLTGLTVREVDVRARYEPVEARRLAVR